MLYLKKYEWFLGKPQLYPANIHVRVTHRINHQSTFISFYDTTNITQFPTFFQVLVFVLLLMLSLKNL